MAQRRCWPGLVSHYASLPPHDRETVTRPGQIGVAFSTHRDVGYDSGGGRRTTSYPGGSVICSGDSPIVWSRVRDHTEALEIYPDPALLTSVGGEHLDPERPWPVDRCVVGRADPVVVGVASVLRRAHLANSCVSDVAASALAHLLVRHVLVEYAGVPVDSDRRPTRLSRGALGRVYDLIEAELHGCLTLDRLAEHAHLSPFHFARAFKASVGMTPHAFVTSRRMDRARDLLLGTDAPVEHVAGDVGFANLSHFRRVFRAHTGATPSQFRALTG